MFCQVCCSLVWCRTPFILMHVYLSVRLSISQPKEVQLCVCCFNSRYSITNRSYRRQHLMNTLLGLVHFYLITGRDLIYLYFLISMPCHTKLPVHPFLIMRSPKHAQIWILKLLPTSRPNCGSIINIFVLSNLL